MNLQILQEADNDVEALIEEFRQIHAKDRHNETYRRRLDSATVRLRRLQQQERGVGAIMALDAAFGLALRRGRSIKVQPIAV